MTFVESVKSAYRNYFTFSGRASRSGFWWYMLFFLIVSVLLGLVDGTGETVVGPNSVAAYAQTGPLGNLWALVNVIPSIAIACRRLHDTDKSGWWQLLGLIPLVGLIILIVWWASRGTAGSNRFGPDPLA